MTNHANQPLPGLTLFLAQRLAQIRQHQQLVRPPALPELTAPDLPAADAAREGGVDDARCVAGQTVAEIEFLGVPPEQPFRRLAEQPRAGSIDELQLVLLVEGEDRDVDFRHHLAE